MKPFYISIGSDYAEAQNNKLYFYYGYEAVNERTEEWLFIVRKGDKQIFELTNSQLMELCDTDSQSPKDMLLTGILAYVSK
jgi:hypothetical protein